MRRVLFLCTANYYRSRFAEQYFNHYARQQGLLWQADSKALSRDVAGEGNLGPISSHSLAYLGQLGLPADAGRFPVRVEREHFTQFERVIAASRDEHYPMMVRWFPELAEQIDYFTVEDLHIYGPEQALPQLVQSLDALLAGLKAEP
ncbi:hypothetical protein [Halioxenophilus sp. WMMB6]|uniref:arsenate-mycothiol transferase ArsC n=1 Tax=Halioxenophilus sp. WMMB6 TaxID=3073815 RepID=UPI00295EC06F|nr:hypothetical protein [Halioxenophilus sp. WMMB6]